MTLQLPYVSIEIKEVLEIEGAISNTFKLPTILYAHVSKPVQDNGQLKEYALVASGPRHGIMTLGNIDPKSRLFMEFDPHSQSYYLRSENRVIKNVSVPMEQVSNLITLEEVLKIDGLRISARNKPKIK